MDLRGPAQAIPTRFGARMLAGIRARPVLVGGGIAFFAVVLIAAIAVPRALRNRIERTAAAHGLAVTVGSVVPGFGTVTLKDVTVVPLAGDPAHPWFRSHSANIAVTLSGLHPTEIALVGGELTVAGDVATLKAEAAKLRGEKTEGSGGGTALTFRASDLDFTWDGGGDPLRAVHAEHLSGRHAAGEDSVSWQTLRVGTAEKALLGVVMGRGELTFADKQLTHANLDTVDVTAQLGAHSPLGKDDGQTDDANAVAVPVVHTAAKGAASETNAFQLPDLSPLRARALGLGAALAERLPVDATVQIAALRVHVVERPSTAQGADRSLVVGPGPLQIARTSEGTTLSFIGAETQGAGASTPLTARLELPARPSHEDAAQTRPETADPKFHLEGGPVALARLGIQEHAFGFVDVEKATLAGTVDVTLAPTGIAFDGKITLRDLGLDEPRLAPDVIHGLSLTIGGRGTQENRTRITLETASLAVGDTHISLRGNLNVVSDDRGGRLVGEGTVDVPTTPCEGMLRSLPAALIPTLKDARMSGTFTAHSTLAFDERDLDHLDFRWLIDDRCRLVEVPAEISRAHFSSAFQHRIYHRDGTLGEEETGPGTSHWASIEDISPYMQVAVLTTEDGGFFRHQGFHHAAIKAALIANLKAHKFARGASTISMQLAKNLFLTRKKTLSRKLEELILTDYLEATFQKSEIMELYLNVIEFGPDIYGIKQASAHYFGRGPSELNVAEAFFLATLLPSPIKHHAAKDRGKLSDDALTRLRALIKIAEKRGNLSKRELGEALTEPVIFHKDGEPRPEPRPRPSSTRFEGGSDDEEELVMPALPPNDEPH